MDRIKPAYGEFDHSSTPTPLPHSPPISPSPTPLIPTTTSTTTTTTTEQPSSNDDSPPTLPPPILKTANSPVRTTRSALAVSTALRLCLRAGSSCCLITRILTVSSDGNLLYKDTPFVVFGPDETNVQHFFWIALSFSAHQSHSSSPYQAHYDEDKKL
uniref:Uncharacterized protein n=1 Tax=Amphimedon queenslandica TaxID=400682 RepID=A0A1X7U9P1_AMPQE